MITTPIKETAERLYKFFDEANWPSLLEATERWQEEVERRYEQAGSPLGEGNALEWFQQAYLTWNYKRDVEEPTMQESILKAQMEMVAMGDGSYANGEYVRGPKNVLRRVAHTTNSILTLADDEGRGLNTLELWELRYTLADANADLEAMMKEKGGKNA